MNIPGKEGKQQDKHDLHIVCEFMSHQFDFKKICSTKFHFFFFMTEADGEADDKCGGVVQLILIINLFF